MTDMEQFNEGSTSVPSKPSIDTPLRSLIKGQCRHIEHVDDADQGEQILEFDPDQIDSSLIGDRFEGAYTESAISELIESMKENGQVVPGMVRLVEGERYQIVYGRRRRAAARILGIKFRAIVRELDDEEAVVLQGIENVGRGELSYIEKCMFARSQVRAGFKRKVVCSSLSTGKSHISEMLKIVAAIPEDLLRYIGPAPSIGRGRWHQLAEIFNADPTRAQGFSSLKPGCDIAKSDERFEQVHESLSNRSKTTKKQKDAHTLSTFDGKLVATLKQGSESATITFKREHGSQFGSWLSTNLDEIYTSYIEDMAS